MPASQPLYHARLNALVRMPFTAREVASFLDPKKRSDPAVQRQITAEHLNSTWSGEVPEAAPAVLVDDPEPCWSAAVLRAAPMGAALDLRHVIDPEAEPAQAKVCNLLYKYGVVAMPMGDGSVLLFDPLTCEFSAWRDPDSAQQAVEASAERRADLQEPPEYSMAEAIRIEVEQERVDPAFLFPVRLSEDGQGAFLRRAFPDVSSSQHDQLMNLSLYGLPDGSSLVFDWNIDEWRSADRPENAIVMLSLKYAPHKLEKWAHKHLHH